MKSLMFKLSAILATMSMITVIFVGASAYASAIVLNEVSKIKIKPIEIKINTSQLHQKEVEIVQEEITEIKNHNESECDLQFYPVQYQNKKPYYLMCTWSMYPTFDCTSQLCVKRTKEVEVGDIVVYRIPRYCEAFKNNQNGATFIIHRVWKVDKDRFYAKSDNKEYYTSENCSIPKSSILGKVTQIKS